MPTAFDVLAKDHQEVKDMLAELAKGRPPPAARPRTSWPCARRWRSNSSSRSPSTRRSRRCTSGRRRTPVRRRRPSRRGAAARAGRQGSPDRLDKAEPGDAEFEQLLATFIKDGREHIAFEETRVWPGMRAALSAEQAEEIGHKLEAGKQTAPTRPHPSTPAWPGVLKPLVPRSPRRTGSVTRPPAGTSSGQRSGEHVVSATGRPAQSKPGKRRGGAPCVSSM